MAGSEVLISLKQALKSPPGNLPTAVLGCALHGGAPLFDPTMVRRPAKCPDGEIILSPYCTLSQYREVIPHELVHCLADTPRWTSLNDTLQDWRYDRTQFIEAVARLVGQMFGQMLVSEPQY